MLRPGPAVSADMTVHHAGSQSRQLTMGPATQRSWDRPEWRAHLCVWSLVPRARDRTVTRSWAPVLAKIDLR